MKSLHLFMVAFSAATFMLACNNNKPANETTSSKTDSVKDAKNDTTQVAELKPAFSNVDPKNAASLNNIVGSYLQIKNALVNDKGSEAADGGKAMGNAIKQIDESLFTA